MFESANEEAEGNIALKADNLPLLISAPPAEFGGPDDEWSPEHLLITNSLTAEIHLEAQIIVEP